MGPSPAPKGPDSAPRRVTLFEGLVLACLLAITAGAWQKARARAQEAQAQRFRDGVVRITESFSDRLGEYELVLQGARGVFLQGFPVTRAGWARYVAGLDLDHHRPGIQGVGFCRSLTPGEAPKVEAALRKGGDPSFRVWPDPAQARSTIEMLEPLDERNRRAIGFDMRSEAVRRTAMDLARDRGETCLSGKVTLVQETGQDPQAGVLMYLPVFQDDAVPERLEDRRARIRGWVYSPFRMGDFSRAVLGGSESALRVEVFDGPDPLPAALLFDGAAASGHRPAWTTVLPVQLQGRVWTFRVSSLPPFERDLDRATPKLVLYSGITISLLIFGLLNALLRLRRRAQALAHRMTEALREEKVHVRRILDSTSEGIYGLDHEGRCTFVNQAFLRMCRCREEDLLGRSVHALTHHSHADGTPYPASECAIYQALRTGRQERLEDEWFWRLDGTGYWANVVVAPILGEEGSVGSVVTVEDVTQKREAEQAKHAFISVVSHELRTPLTSIRGTLGLLASRTIQEHPEEAAGLISIALRNAERLGHLINDILDFEKLRSGRLMLCLETLSVSAILEEALEGNLPFAASHQVALHLDLPPGNPHLRVDRKRMIQVLTNLISNAVKFSPAGGTVRLGARREGGRVHLEVEDHGQGIPESFRHRLFTPFSQAEAPDVRRQEGSGLGLSIAKALVEDMGGTLTFRTEEGQGTTFIVGLPESEPPE